MTGIIGTLMMPWKLLADAATYIGKWLVGYSGGLAAIAGVLIADYWLVRRKQLELPDLYRSKGAYTYLGGWNPAAVLATVVGCALSWIGLFVKPLRVLFDYAWFIGVLSSAGVYVLLMKTMPPPPPVAASEGSE